MRSAIFEAGCLPKIQAGLVGFPDLGFDQLWEVAKKIEKLVKHTD